MRRKTIILLEKFKEKKETNGTLRKRKMVFRRKSKLFEKYGDVPPPWVYYPDVHPVSIGWRMGSGEGHLMVLGEWFDEQNFNFEERLAYLKKYPAPARWYEWIVQFLYNINYPDTMKIEYSTYFEKLKELGFENVDDFEKDSNRTDLR